MKVDNMIEYYSELLRDTGTITNALDPKYLNRVGNVISYMGPSNTRGSQWDRPRRVFNIIMMIPEMNPTSMALFKQSYVVNVANILSIVCGLENVSVDHGDIVITTGDNHNQWMSRYDMKMVGTTGMFYLGLYDDFGGSPTENEHYYSLNLTESNISTLHADVHNMFYRILQETFFDTLKMQEKA